MDVERSAFGATNTLLKELQAEDPAEFRALLKMDVERFETLLNNIAPHIQRSNTIMREAIPARVKLQIALTYLTTGMGYRYLQAQYLTSRAAISLLMPEVMDAIITYLEPFMKVK